MMRQPELSDASGPDNGGPDSSSDGFRAPSGTLDPEGRRAAIAAALPLLGTYFAAGSQPLYVAPAVTAGRDPQNDLPELLIGLRFRVALATAIRLLEVLGRIVDRPNFRYDLVSIDSPGAVMGQLDVTRYALRAGWTSDVPTYPVLEVRRAERTPENVLAVYAATWLSRELSQCRTILGGSAEGSPELGACNLRLRKLADFLRLPALAGCTEMARGVSRKGDERALLATVQRRLRRREVGNPTPYQQLAEWVERCLDGGAAADPGDVDWEFYGERFDAKLFELWCLSALATEVSRQLLTDVPRACTDWKGRIPVYSWDRPAGALHLYFQRSVATIAGVQARWRRADGTGPALGGVPDIVACALQREGDNRRFAVLDSKLRQRDSLPAEEIYKIIGYFDNFWLRDCPVGGIVYHTSSMDTFPSFEFRPEGTAGTILAVAVNPAHPEQSGAALAPVATMLLELLGIPPLNVSNVEVDAADSADELAEAQVEGRLRELRALAGNLPNQLLEASRRRVRAALGEPRWNRLADDIRTMLATSEHVGFSLDRSADFSGPVIGICSSVEAVLHAEIIEPGLRQNVRLRAGCRTLGQAIHVLQRAVNAPTDQTARAIRQHLHTLRVDPNAIRELVAPLQVMNTRYRIPAAHRELVGELTWRAAWGELIGHDRLLARVVDAVYGTTSIS